MVYQSEKGEFISLEAQEDIPSCHKVALEIIEKDGDVLKYGELIGRANRQIGKGFLVNHENIHSVPRDYESELVEDDGVDAPEFDLFFLAVRAAVKVLALLPPRLEGLSISYLIQAVRMLLQIRRCLRRFLQDSHVILTFMEL